MMITIYTDGACKGNGKSGDNAGGFGVFIRYPDGNARKIWGGEPATTNNRMELLGAIVALQSTPADMPVQIFTDSNYVKDGITKWIVGWKKKGWKKADGKPVLNLDLWQQLDALTQNRTIDWQWVKGHNGDDGNEMADTLANLGVTGAGDEWQTNLDKSSSNPLSNENLSNAQLSNENLSSHHFLNNNLSNNHLSNGINDNFKNDNLPNELPTPPNTMINEMTPNTTAEAMILEVAPTEVTPLEVASLEATPSETPPEQTMTDEKSLDQINAELAIASDQSSASNTTDTAPKGEKGEKSKKTAKKKPKKIPKFTKQPIDYNEEQNPEYNGDTSDFNFTFRPILPIAQNSGVPDRQLIMDTETTGFDENNGDRIVEVGIIELVGRKFTGQKLHIYINPEKEMDEEVIRVHGISNEFLVDKPLFAEIAPYIAEFTKGAELIAHNATFDMRFLDMEFERAGLQKLSEQVQVVDSLMMARRMFPGQRNTLDALVQRLGVGQKDRTFHGALLDSEILAEVFLAMTSGQVALNIEAETNDEVGNIEHEKTPQLARLLVQSISDLSADDAWRQSVLKTA